MRRTRRKWAHNVPATSRKQESPALSAKHVDDLKPLPPAGEVPTVSLVKS